MTMSPELPRGFFLSSDFVMTAVISGTICRRDRVTIRLNGLTSADLFMYNRVSGDTVEKENNIAKYNEATHSSNNLIHNCNVTVDLKLYATSQKSLADDRDSYPLRY